MTFRPAQSKKKKKYSHIVDPSILLSTFPCNKKKQEQNKTDRMSSISSSDQNDSLNSLNLEIEAIDSNESFEARRFYIVQKFEQFQWTQPQCLKKIVLAACDYKHFYRFFSPMCRFMDIQMIFGTQDREEEEQGQPLFESIAYFRCRNLVRDIKQDYTNVEPRKNFTRIHQVMTVMGSLYNEDIVPSDEMIDIIKTFIEILQSYDDWSDERWAQTTKRVLQMIQFTLDKLVDDSSETLTKTIIPFIEDIIKKKSTLGIAGYLWSLGIEVLEVLENKLPSHKFTVISRSRKQDGTSSVTSSSSSSSSFTDLGKWRRSQSSATQSQSLSNGGTESNVPLCALFLINHPTIKWNETEKRALQEIKHSNDSKEYQKVSISKGSGKNVYWIGTRTDNTISAKTYMDKLCKKKKINIEIKVDERFG